MRRSALRHAAIALAAMALAACATLNRPDEVAPTEVSATGPFAIAGRLSARRGSDGIAANFYWTHADGLDRIDLATPMGQVVARLEGDDTGVRVERPGGESGAYPNWSALTNVMCRDARRCCGRRRGRSSTLIQTKSPRHVHRVSRCGIRKCRRSRYASSSIAGARPPTPSHSIPAMRVAALASDSDGNDSPLRARTSGAAR